MVDFCSDCMSDLCAYVFIHVFLFVYIYNSLLMSYDVIVQYYDAVVEVCLCAANQKDPQELALHHYKSGHPESDVQGRSALNDRCALIENLMISMHE